MFSTTATAFYLGACETCSLMQNTVSSTRSLEERLIEHLESHQLIGKLSKNVSESHEKVFIEITKHGLKISSTATSFVKVRVPLLELVVIITFFDGFGKSNIVFVEKNATPVYQLHLLQLVNTSSSANLCNKLKDYLPEFPIKNVSKQKVIITMRQLLSHTAGIRHYSNFEKKKSSLEDPRNNNTLTEEFLSNKKYTTTLDALEIFKNDDLVVKPGTKFSYTTYGITLAAAVLERVSGKTYRALSSKLFSELGMKKTELDGNEKIVKERVSYYRRNSRHVLENCPEVDCSYKYAGGGIISNVTDLIIFANAVLHSFQSNSTNSLLKKETMERFLTPHVSVNESISSGLGWFLVAGSSVTSLDDYKYECSYIYHTGAAVGASSVLMIRPDKQNSEITSGVCVAILCNVQDVSVLPLSISIIDLFAASN